MAEAVFYSAQLFQGMLTDLFPLLLGTVLGGLGGRLGFWVLWTELKTADVEVFFEPIGLKEV